MTCGTLNKQIFLSYSYDTWHSEQTKHPYAFGFQYSSILIFVTIYIIFFKTYISCIYFFGQFMILFSQFTFFWIYELMKWTNFYFYFHDDNIIIIIIMWDNFIIIYFIIYIKEWNFNEIVLYNIIFQLHVYLNMQKKLHIFFNLLKRLSNL
jgi:hypothetical protein